MKSGQQDMFIVRLSLLTALAGVFALLLCSCDTPQERSGYNPRPFNEPATWETHPYNFQN